MIKKFFKSKIFLGIIILIFSISTVLLVINHNRIEDFNKEVYLEDDEMEELLKFFTEEQIKTLQDIKKINNHPLYVMNYYGDYGFQNYLEDRKKRISSAENISNDWACSGVAAMGNKEQPIFGRNFDWDNCPTLVLFTKPDDGYASVSVVNLQCLGYSTETNILDMSIKGRRRLLAAPNQPFDGMNEMGVAVGMMAVRNTKASNDSSKPTIGSLEFIRLILDYAANTDEAIELIKGYNVSFPPGPPLHYLISDRDGKSAVIEFVEGELKIIYNEEPYQVATNFMIYASDERDKENCSRYSLATKKLEKADGVLFQKEVINLMKDISVTRTQWTSVYNMGTGEINIFTDGKFDEKHTFNLEMSK